MSSVVIAGDTSGTVTLQAPAVAGTTTLNLPTISGGTLVTSDASGNVGIGTTTPGTLLEVVGTSAGANVYQARFRNGGTTAGTQASILLTTNATPTGDRASVVVSGVAEDALGNMAMLLSTATLGGVAAERMRITSTGTITSTLGGMQVRSGTAVLATGTSVDFTSIPTWVKKITIMFGSVSSSGTSSWQIQLGTSGSVHTTGYLGAYGYTGSGNASINLTTGFGLYNDSAGDLRSGTITLTLQDATNNTWTCSGLSAWSTRAYCLPTAGAKTLTTVLDRVRITTLNGTDTFDAGSINILYE